MCRYSGPLGALKGSMSKGVPKTEVANIKAKNATIAFSLHVLSSSSLFLIYFSSPFPSLVWFSSLSGAVYCKFRKVRFQKKKRLDILSLQDSTPKQRLQGCFLMIGQSEITNQKKLYNQNQKAQGTRWQGSINHAWQRRFSNGTNFWMVFLSYSAWTLKYFMRY